MKKCLAALLFVFLLICLLPSTARAVQVPDQKNEAANTTVATARSVAQSFRPTESGLLTSIKFKLQSTDGMQRTMQLRLFEADENGLPTGGEIANSGYRSMQGSNSVNNWFSFDGFNRLVFLSGEKQYVIVIEAMNGDFQYQYAYNDTDVYDRGTMLANDGVWSVAAGDLQFQTWQNRCVRYIAGPDSYSTWYIGSTYRPDLHKLYDQDTSAFTAVTVPAINDMGGQEWGITRLGYQFRGWSTDAYADTVTYTPSDSYSLDPVMTLYGVWAANSGLPNRYTMPIGGAINWEPGVFTNSYDPSYIRQSGYQYTALKVGSTIVGLRYQDPVEWTQIWHYIRVEIEPDLPESFTMVDGDTVTWISKTPGGSWNYDGNFFGVNGTSFSAKKVGTSNVRYTVNGVAQNIAVTIISNLPDTHTMTTAQTFTLSPTPAGGQWGYDTAFFDFNGSVFSPKKAGNTAITYTVNGVTQSIAVTVNQAITGLPASAVLIDGDSISYNPQPEGGSWNYDNAYFDFVEGSGTFTSKKAGTTSIAYTTSEGVVHNIAVTIVTNLADSHTMINDGAVTFAPVPGNGIWAFDGTFFNRSGSTFIAKKAGTTTITYSMGGLTQNIAMTVVTNLADSHSMINGESVTFNPTPSDGQWGYDNTFFDCNGATFTAKKTGNTTITYTVNGVAQSISVWVKQAITNLTSSLTMIVGDDATWAPQPSGGIWSFSDVYFDRSGLTFTAKQAGITTVSYTTPEDVTANIAVTIVTNLPDSHTMLNGQSVAFLPNPSNGQWGYDSAFFFRSGSTFFSLKAGNSTITYTVNGVMQSVAMTLVTDLPDSHTMIDGESVNFATVHSNGQWGFDDTFFERSGASFTAKKAGESAITYTLNGVVQSIAVTSITNLADSHTMLDGESVIFAPVPGSGLWGYDGTAFDFDGSTFTAKKAGNFTIAYTVNGVAQSIAVWVKQTISGLPQSHTLIVGDTVTWALQPIGGTWTADAAYFDRAGLTFTAKQAGTSVVAYTTAEGVTQSITVTIITNLIDSHTMIDGESATFAPIPGNGLWGFDSTFFDRNGTTYTAKKAGQTDITYTMNGLSQSIAVTVITDLIDSHTMVDGEQLSFSPIPSNGLWGYDSAFFDRSGSNFTAKKAGESIITYTVNGVEQSIAVTIAKNLPDNHTMINGESVTFAPVPSTGLWGYDNTFFDANGSTFTAKNAGLTTIAYTVNGVTQSIVVTVITDLKDSHTMFEGETITFAPIPGDGLWGFDSNVFVRKDSTFTARRAALSTIVYTVNGVSQSIAVTVKQKVGVLVESHSMSIGDTVVWNTLQTGGSWAYDDAFFSRTEDGTFIAKKTGTSTITYTVNGAVQRFVVTISASMSIQGKPITVTTMGTNIKIRANANATSKVLGSLSAGQSFEMLAYNNGFVLILFRAERAQRAWISADSLSWTYPHALQGVATQSQPVFSKMGEKAKIAVLRAGQEIQVIGRNGKWLVVEYLGATAYVLAKNTAVLNFENEVRGVLKVRTPLYASMDAKSKSMLTVKKGAAVKIKEFKDGWFVIEYNGQIGYIQAMKVKVIS